MIDALIPSTAWTTLVRRRTRPAFCRTMNERRRSSSAMIGSPVTSATSSSETTHPRPPREPGQQPYPGREQRREPAEPGREELWSGQSRDQQRRQVRRDRSGKYEGEEHSKRCDQDATWELSGVAAAVHERRRELGAIDEEELESSGDCKERPVDGGAGDRRDQQQKDHGRGVRQIQTRPHYHDDQHAD